MRAATRNALMKSLAYTKANSNNTKAKKAKSNADKASSDAVAQQKKVAGEVTNANDLAKSTGATKNAAEDALEKAAAKTKSDKTTANGKA